jgi:predicted amidohydrolase
LSRRRGGGFRGDFATIVMVFGAVLALLATLAAPAVAQEARPQGKTARICAVSLSWAEQDRNLKHVLELLDQAGGQRAHIVCLPQECVPTDGGETARAALEAIAKAAARHKMYVVANLREKDAQRVYLTSYLIGPDGAQVGKYRKSHRMPDEAVALGDQLPVFDTAFGKVGLMVGTDRYWPEVPLVMALKGAEIVLASLGVEPVPQGFPLDLTLRVRAIDDHVTLAAANYAGDLPYLCSNYPAYTGQPLGRAFVVDRSGVVVADTGFRPGVAVAPIDPARPKDIYHLTFSEDRKLFHYLTDPSPANRDTQTKSARRKIKVSIATVGFEHGPDPKPDSEFAKILDEAAGRGSDVVLMSEFGLDTDDENGRKTLALVAEKARKHKTYVIIGGLRDPQLPYRKGGRASWAYLWDREGKVVGKYRISQYGDSVELPVFRTDFGVIGIILCGDIYSQEITRALAVQGAEIVFCPSQSWGPSGTLNLWMQQARAIDNGLYMAAAHLPMSDAGQRSYVVDPYGQVMAASSYWSDSVCTAEVDLGAGQVWFARSDKPGAAGQKGYLAAYYPKSIPEKRTDLRAVLLAGRRPELYGAITEKTLADRHHSQATWEKMGTPRRQP